jgi:dTDP-4-amino-4,6-dideoxygalactose transaminase
MGPPQDRRGRQGKPIFVVRPSLPPLGEYAKLLRRVWSSRILTNNGPLAVELETRLSRYLPARHLAVVANGTLALQLAFRAMGGAKGDVATTPFTFAATTTALAWEGYKPRFVDINPETFNLDPDRLAEVVSDDTVGVVSVHVFGNPAGSAEVAAISRATSQWTIFDAAHSFGTRLKGPPLYDLGDASTLSFHATKSFHTFEGGAVASTRKEIIDRVRVLRNFGLEGHQDVRTPGLNAKMSEAHAAMGLANLRHVDGWITARRRRYRLYQELLGTVDRITFQKVDAARYNFNYMPVLFPSRKIRNRVYLDLQSRAIYPRLYFSPLTSSFSFLRKKTLAKLPVARDVADRILTLPLYPDLSLDDVRRISGHVRSIVRSAKS